MLARLLAVLVACGAATAFAADPAPTVTREFAVTTTLELKTTDDGKTITNNVNNEYRYAWQRAGKERALLLRAVGFGGKGADGKTISMLTSRAGATVTVNGKVTKEQKYEDLPEERKKAVRELFDNPIYTLEVDDGGKVAKRTWRDAPEIKPLAGQGLGNVVTLFHPPYPANKDKWESEATVQAIGDVTGKLEYTKAAGGKGGQLVKVAGTFRADEVKFPDTQKKKTELIKNVKYAITGTQTYDPARKEWIAGKLDIEASADLIADGKVFGSMNGKATITFEMLPGKK